MTPAEYLREQWIELRDGHGSSLWRANGAVDGFLAIGSLNEEQAELWHLRFKGVCPGHDDEGGRDWCAYCGEMNRTAEGR
jgi:hypothetical protein